MNLSIGVTTNKVFQSKSAVISNQKPKQQVYSNNVFDEFSKEASTSTKSAVIEKNLCVEYSPSFKGSTTA